MARTDTTMAFYGPSRSVYDHHSSPSFDFLPLSSTSHRDLLGFSCINNIAPSVDDSSAFLAKTCPVGRSFEGDYNIYPSPPPTGSERKRTVPLPSQFMCDGPGPSSYESGHIGGILDSPLVTHHNVLASQRPLSPPPTIPTPTLELPPTDNQSFPFQEEGSYACPPLDELQSPKALLETTETPGDLGDQLLSPLSPEWESHGIAADNDILAPDSVLLAESEHQEYSPPFSEAFDDFQSSNDISMDTDCATRPILPLLHIPGPYQDSFIQWEPPPHDLHAQLFQPFSQRDSMRSPEDYSSHEGYSSAGDSSSAGSSSEDDFYLDDVDDDLLDSPSSPSLRSFSRLPELGEDDDMSIPRSPTPSLLCLPGAEPDEDLISADLAPLNFNPEPYATVPFSRLSSSSKHSLLLLDDPNDVPPPRSPSPENFDLDSSAIAGCSDPNLQKLLDLRRRSQSLEREAKQREQRMLEVGKAYDRAEARRTRKSAKERSREITAMLRLKLDSDCQSSAMPQVEGDHAELLEPQGMEEQEVPKRVESTPPVEGTKSAKTVISSMAQLVAKMMFRRHESFRPMMSTTSSLGSRHSKSKLSQVLAEEDEDCRMDADHPARVPSPMQLDDVDSHWQYCSFPSSGLSCDSSLSSPML